MSSGSQRPLLAVLAVALLVRAAALWLSADARPILDEQQYLLRAHGLLDGRGFLGSYQSWVLHEGPPAQLPQYPGAWQPPGQSVLVAAAMALSGRSVLAVKAVQVMLSVLSVALVYGLGRAWFDRRAGLAAAWLAALYPNLIAFSHYLWSETLFTFLLLLALWLLTRRGSPPATREALAGGVVVGLAALTRATALALPLILAPWMMLAWRHAPRRALRTAALAAGATALVVIPWSVRNSLLHGGLVLIETNSAYNLWRGNGPDSFVGRDDVRQPRYAFPFDGLPLFPVMNREGHRLVREAKRDLGRERPTDLEIVEYARATAWQQVREHPGTFVARIPIRLVDMWNPTSFLVRHLRIGGYGDLPPALELAIGSAAVATYLAVVGLAAVGAWWARHRSETWLVLLLALLLSAASAVSFGLTRFRLPLMPLFMVLAGPVVASWRRPAARHAAAAALPLALLACDDPRPVPEGPNVLWVVWDTVRADRMSLYGHDRPTTPKLDAWARGGRVYDDATATAGYTLPTHASMFTGLLPSEHCAHNDHPRLQDRFTTVAEILHAAGWRTFLFSANPHVSEEPSRNFAQGFETAEHPWSPRWKDEALRLVQAKLSPEDRSSELPSQLASGDLRAWNVKASGALAERAVLDWLDRSDPDRPWLVFVNYTEAHRPLVPPRRYRELLMSEDRVWRSYTVDRSWSTMWEYTLGLRDYSEDELELTRETYDAALRELDDLFASLLASLEARGELDDTLVILTSDHGEHLGESHMLDHQYSLHQVLLRVPLVLHHPDRVSPGRETRPVSTLDLFATVLELTGTVAPEDSPAHGVSLLAPREKRLRLAEEPAPSQLGVSAVQRTHPDFDPTPFLRRQRALLAGRHKYLQRSDGSSALYDLERDPGETRDLGIRRPDARKELSRLLDAEAARLSLCDASGFEPLPTPSPEALEQLRALGYAEPSP